MFVCVCTQRNKGIKFEKQQKNLKTQSIITEV